MELITLVLLVIILLVIIKFRNFVTVSLNKIEADIQQLKKILPPPVPGSSGAPVKKEAEEISSAFAGDNKKSILEKIDVPVIPAPKINIPEKTINFGLKEEAKETPVAASTKNKESSAAKAPRRPTFFEKNPDFEKFIGDNLVSKICIAFLVLAIGFFVKFANDNNWLGPLGRVGIGLICGGVFIFFAQRLHKTYKAFSSVLVGGGLAILYFTITLAYRQFHLFSPATALVIMIFITVFAVILSILYNREELAVIALAGGFAAPFLVSNGSGNYLVLFTYLIVLNTGFLLIAYQKAWRLLNILAFIFTVILFSGWLFSPPGSTLPAFYGNGFAFAAIFYALFFFINIAHNVKENKKFIASDFSILLINTALFFAAGLY